MDKLINKYRKLITESEEPYLYLDQLYREYKTRVFNYFNGRTIDKEWDNYISELIQIENDIPIAYIMDTNISKCVNGNLQKSVMKKRGKVLNNFEIEDVLDYLAFYGRSFLANNDINAYDDFNVTAKCEEGAKEVDLMASTLGLKHRIIRIDPGFSFVHCLLNGYGFHYFNIIEHKGRYYLVDVTYKQFFKKSKCSLEKLGVPKCFPPLAGAFMVQDEIRRKVAETLLKRGWIELTPEVIKAYFDGFAISSRNGLYYEYRNLVFGTDYTDQDYRRFIQGLDNQVNYEGKIDLGYQLRPLRNPSMRFK